MQYRARTDVFFDGEVRPTGSVLEINDEELAKTLLERRTIVAVDEEVNTSPYSAFNTAKLGADQREAAINAESGLPGTAAPEAPAPAAPLDPSQPPASQPLDPVSPPAGPGSPASPGTGQPTPDQVAAALADVEKSNTTPPLS